MVQDTSTTDAAEPDSAPGFSSPALTVDELAALLKINRKTLYGLIQDGQLPGAVKLGRSIRIHGPTVLAWLSTGQVPVSQTRKGRR